MPTISIFFGFVVQMYWREHPPPHVHVLYQGYEALIAIESAQVIAGSLPPAALRIVRPWIEHRRAELLANWDRAGAASRSNALRERTLNDRNRESHGAACS